MQGATTSSRARMTSVRAVHACTHPPPRGPRVVTAVRVTEPAAVWRPRAHPTKSATMKIRARRRRAMLRPATIPLRQRASRVVTPVYATARASAWNAFRRQTAMTSCPAPPTSARAAPARIRRPRAERPVGTRARVTGWAPASSDTGSRPARRHGPQVTDSAAAQVHVSDY
jgi:hypothetical protein